MRAAMSRYLSMQLLSRRTLCTAPFFSSPSIPMRGSPSPAPSRIHLVLSCSTLPIRATMSSPPTACCHEAEKTQEMNPGPRHKEGFSDQFIGNEAEDPDMYDDEEDDEGGYAKVGSHHIPVLLSEVVAAFHDVQLHTFVDCTLGAAGHASSIITAHPELQRFVGFDVDPMAHSKASSRLQAAVEHRNRSCAKLSTVKIDVLKANFKNMKTCLQQIGLECGVDGVLMDLGMSSMQLNVAERGFSLQLDGPLDMRMDPMVRMTASDVLNTWPEAELGKILREFGEEKHWKRLAKNISEAQQSGGIHSTFGLLDVIQKSLPLRYSPGRAGWKKTATRVFQALRIAVNDELSSLRAALPVAFECLKPGGCLVVISFHSLEDRIVKQFFLEAMGDSVVRKSKKLRESRDNPSMPSIIESGGGEFRTRLQVVEGTHASILTKRPLTAGLDELKLNPKARSAKLRILVKK